MLRLLSRWLLCASVAVLAGLAACNGDDDDGAPRPGDDGGNADCIDPLPLDCRPSFEPATYDAIFSKVLRPSCGSSASGTQCHGAAGMQAGLVLADLDEGYDSLLGTADGRPRVVPGKPECSILIQRLEASDREVRMPLNADPLDESVRCAIRLWIADGAER